MSDSRNRTLAIIGAGDFIGSAIARRFAAEGYIVFAGRRNGDKLQPLKHEIEASGGCVVIRSLDARDEAHIIAFLAEAEARAPLDICVFNVGATVRFPLVDTTARVFRKVWEMCCFAGFLAGREAAKQMLPRGKGSIFFTGATAGGVAAPDTLPLPVPSSLFVQWHRPRPVKSDRKVFTWRTW